MNMKHENKSGFRMGRYYLLNTAIVGMILCIYLLTASADIHMVMGKTGVAPYYKGHEDVRAVALAVHVDHYAAETAREIMDILIDQGATATFFVYGEFAAEYPETVRSLEENGFEVASLGSEAISTAVINRTSLRSKLLWAGQSIERVVQQPVKLFSPADGRDSRELLDVASSLGYKTVLWSVDAYAAGASSATIKTRALNNITKGAIIRVRALPETAEALGDIVGTAHELDYEFKTVGTLLQSD